MTDKKQLRIYFSKTVEIPEISYRLKSKIREAIERTLEYENFPYDTEVSLTLCDNAYIKELNRDYRGKDTPTDVLSFPMYEDGNFPPDECLLGAPIGDIVISVERAREQAQELSNTTEREISFLTVHSMLHLLGYDHERSPEDDERQCEAQREIISQMTFE